METDRAKLHTAFLALRPLGFWARMAQESRGPKDGWSMVPPDVLQRCGAYLYYPDTDDSAFDGDGFLREPLTLHHQPGDVRAITKQLDLVGLDYTVEADVVTCQPAPFRALVGKLVTVDRQGRPRLFEVVSTQAETAVLMGGLEQLTVPLSALQAAILAGAILRLDMAG